MKEKKKIFWIIGLSLILLTICIIGIIVIKNIYMKDKYIDEDGKATTIDTPQGDVYEEAKYSKEKVEKSEQYFLKYGKSSTLVGRLTPGVRSFISLPAGLVKMPLNSFIFYTAAGSGIWNLILATVGYFLYSRKELLEKYFTEISIVMLIVGIGFFTYLIIRSTRKKNN